MLIVIIAHVSKCVYKTRFSKNRFYRVYNFGILIFCINDREHTMYVQLIATIRRQRYYTYACMSRSSLTIIQVSTLVVLNVIDGSIEQY